MYLHIIIIIINFFDIFFYFYKGKKACEPHKDLCKVYKN